MTIPDADAIIAVIGAIVAIIGAVATWRQTASTTKKTEFDSLKAIVEAHQQEANGERERNQQLVDRLRAANDRIYELECDRQETHKKLNETLDKLAGMQDELDRTCKANGELLARVAALEGERDQLLRRIDMLEDERDRLASEVRKLGRRSFK